MKILKIIHGYPPLYNARSERKKTEKSNLDIYYVNNPNGKDEYGYDKNRERRDSRI